MFISPRFLLLLCVCLSSPVPAEDLYGVGVLDVRLHQSGQEILDQYPAEWIEWKPNPDQGGGRLLVHWPNDPAVGGLLILNEDNRVVLIQRKLLWSSDVSAFADVFHKWHKKMKEFDRQFVRIATLEDSLPGSRVTEQLLIGPRAYISLVINADVNTGAVQEITMSEGIATADYWNDLFAVHQVVPVDTID